MAVSDRHQLTLDTAAGRVDVWVQDARTLYVRAGLTDATLLEEAREPLDAGRGALVSFRGHFTLGDDGTVSCAQPFVHRVDQARDREPTRAMINRVRDAISVALTGLGATPEEARMLAEAQRDVNDADAVERVALAAQLRRIADHLDREARELRAGGVKRNRRRTLSSGLTERVVRVQRPDGTFMDVCPEPPTIYGASRYPGTHITSEENE